MITKSGNEVNPLDILGEGKVMSVPVATIAAATAKKFAERQVVRRIKREGNQGNSDGSHKKIAIIAVAVVSVIILVLSILNGVAEGAKSIILTAPDCDSGLDGSISETTDSSTVNTDGIVVHADYKSAGYSTVGSTYPNVNPPLTSKIVFPYSGGAMTTSSTYGWRIHPVTGARKFHAGEDIARTGDFNSIADGIVVKVYDPADPSISPVITIKHNINGKVYFSTYLHWSKSYVKVGDAVTAGQKVGVTGTRGPSTGIHLHLQIAEGAEDNIINPATFLSQMGATSDYASSGSGGTMSVTDALEACENAGLSGTLTSDARSIIIAAAKSQLGVPYVWGGETESMAFDCSGLVKYAYSKAGFSLDHKAQSQYDAAKKITQSQAQPGDLIFWGTPSNVYHVAIYLGGNQMIEAPQMGANVHITTIWGIPLSFGTFDLGDSVSGGDAKTYARNMVSSMWRSSSEFTCLDKLWTKESGWNPLAANPSSGAYGIPQSLPGSKMASAGSDWKTNPKTQINWGLNYIQGRYGSPCSAWAHSQSTNWY